MQSLAPPGASCPRLCLLSRRGKSRVLLNNREGWRVLPRAAASRAAVPLSAAARPIFFQLRRHPRRINQRFEV